MGRPRKKISELNLANGKVWNGQEIETKKSHPYNNLSIAEYKKKIESMNLLDLQEHAISILVPVKQDRNTLINSLLKEFKFRTLN